MVKFFSIFAAMVTFISLVGTASAANLGQLTEDERVVALTILGEARGEGEVGMQAVACVIQQRSIERKKTVAQVCLQRKQFSCWNGTTAESLEALVIRKTPQKVLNVASALAKDLVAKKELDRSLVRNANHYCTLETFPAWAEGVEPVVVIGQHKFYKL